MLLLGLSVLAFWIAPILSKLHFDIINRLPRSERFVYIIVLVLLGLGFLPEHLQRDGVFAVLKLAFAFGCFWLLESILRRLQSRSLHPMLLFGLLLSVHCLIDGMVLSLAPSLMSHLHPIEGLPVSSHGDSLTILGVSIILHRLPIGMGIWAFISKQRSTPAAIAILTLASVMTLAGFAIGKADLVAIVDYQSLLPELEYLIAGGLIHMGGHSLRAESNLEDSVMRSQQSSTWQSKHSHGKKP